MEHEYARDASGSIGCDGVVNSMTGVRGGPFLEDYDLQAWDLPEATPVACRHAIADGNRSGADQEIMGSPFYGIEGRGWFLGVHVFTRYVKVAFFRGSSLRPVPPGSSIDKDTRYVDIHEGDELDEAQRATWLKQAAALPGGRGLGR